MLGRHNTQVALKDASSGAKHAARELARDEKLRRQLMAALHHGSAAAKRARQKQGIAALVGNLAADKTLRQELANLRSDLERARSRLEKKRRHTLRNWILVLGALGAAALAGPRLRGKLDGGNRLVGTADTSQGTGRDEAGQSG
jgi:signal transduction protein with GAF and PtsI domain